MAELKRFETVSTHLISQCEANTNDHKDISMECGSVGNFIRSNCVEILRKVNLLTTTNNDNVNIIVIGNISKGKSCMINALLRSNIMSSDNEHTTRCFVRVSKSNESKIITLKKTEIFCSDDGMVEAEVGKCMAALEDNDKITDEELEIHLANESPILKDNVYLYDSMRLTSDKEILKGYIKKKCEKMDILIVILCPKDTEDKNYKEDIKDLCSSLPHIPVLILIYEWDIFVKYRTAKAIETKKMKIEEYLKDIFNSTEVSDWHSYQYFFISAADNNTTSNDGTMAWQLNDEFVKFETCLLDLINHYKDWKVQRIRSVSAIIEDQLKRQQNQYELIEMELSFKEAASSLKQRFVDLLSKWEGLDPILNQLVLESTRSDIPMSLQAEFRKKQMKLKTVVQKLSDLGRPSTYQVHIACVGESLKRNASVINTLFGQNIPDIWTRSILRLSMSGENRFVSADNNTTCGSVEDVIQRALQSGQEELDIFLKIDNSILMKNVYIYETRGLENTQLISEKYGSYIDALILVKEGDESLEEYSRLFGDVPIFIFNTSWKTATPTLSGLQPTGTQSVTSSNNSMTTWRNIPIIARSSGLESLASDLRSFVKNVFISKKQIFKGKSGSLENELIIYKDAFDHFLQKTREEYQLMLDSNGKEIAYLLSSCSLFDDENEKNSMFQEMSDTFRKLALEYKDLLENIIVLKQQLNVTLTQKSTIKHLNSTIGKIKIGPRAFNEAIEKYRDMYRAKVSEATQQTKNCIANGKRLITKVEALNIDHTWRGQRIQALSALVTDWQETIRLLDIVKRSIGGEINILCAGIVSTGKSYIINSLIGRSIMKSSTSHTTRSFVRFSKANDKPGVDLPNGRHIECVDDAAIQVAVNDYMKELGKNFIDQSIQIYFKTGNKLFERDSVFLYDTPGLDQPIRLLDFIKTKCNFTDILIYIVNNNVSEDVISDLKIISKQIPTFILFNKWDETDDEEDADKDRSFLEETVTMITGVRATTRDKMHFFVSGTEMIANINRGPSGEKQKMRCREFKTFKSQLETFIHNNMPMREKYRRHNFIDADHKQQYVNEKNIIKNEITSLNNACKAICEDISKLLKNIAFEEGEVEKLRKDVSGKMEVGVFTPRIKQINDSFSLIHTVMQKILNAFTTKIPNSPKDLKNVDHCSTVFESQLRRINYAATSERNWTIFGISTGVAGGAAATAGLVAVEVAAGPLGWIIGGLTVLLAGTGLVKRILNGRETVEVMNECIKNYREAYLGMRELLETSEMNKRCKILIEAYENFLKDM